MFNINRELFVILLLIFYVSAIYRMAILISIDTGLLEISERFRTWINDKLIIYNEKIEDIDFEKHTFLYYKWRIFYNLDEGINCTNCTGVWSAIILGGILILSLYWDYTSIIIFALGGAGFQHYLTNREDELIV